MADGLLVPEITADVVKQDARGGAVSDAFMPWSGETDVHDWIPLLLSVCAVSCP